MQSGERKGETFREGFSADAGLDALEVRVIPSPQRALR
jgi:hypothetical protein